MKRILYLGTDPTQFESLGNCEGHLIHYPVIKIVPLSPDTPEICRAFAALDSYTHLLFTSKNAVKIFASHFFLEPFANKTVIAIGAVTAAHLKIHSLPPQYVAKQETQEGVIELLSTLDLKDSYLFLPRSSLSRPVLIDYFQQKGIRYEACDLYETVTQRPEGKIDLESIDEIIFTSPSTVTGFLEIFLKIPKGKKLVTVGPVTEQFLYQTQQI